ncbi:cytochrome P450 [Streptomyces sp. RP5T]|uniref:cytochrome P450 n=1 Tax=Streptomyces sp. RP5T TaxID=2490848 RepID=UPI0021AD6C1C|nr:cytochrome P450 [Streptomyces sp. RP5T]
MPLAVPSVPGAVPVLGHTRMLSRKPMDFLSSLTSGPDLVKIRLGPHPVVIICNPDLTQQMLSDSRTFDKGGPLVDLVAPLVGEGLATCPLSKHKPARQLFQPIFNRGMAAAHANRFPSAVAKVTAGWRDGLVLDMPVEARRLTIQVAVDTLFADVFSEQEVDQIADDLTSWQVGAAQRMSRPPVFDLLPTPTNRRFDVGLKRVRQTVTEAITRHRRSGREKVGVLGALLSPEGERIPWFNTPTLVDHAMTFLIAPTATVSTVLCWIWHELAQRSELQARLQTEVDTVLGGEAPTFEHLPELELTKRIVTEALRLYPSIHFAPLRTVTTDTRLGEYDLPAGTVVAYSPYIIHRRHDLYENPELFDPDRWLGAKLPMPSRHAFIPFGHGTRQCIAGEYAFNEAVLTVAAIASHWRLESVAGTPLPTRGSVNLTPRGLRLQVSRRISFDETTDAGQPHGTEGGRQRPTQSKAWLI